jgi:hypothetical protein
MDLVMLSPSGFLRDTEDCFNEGNDDDEEAVDSSSKAAMGRELEDGGRRKARGVSDMVGMNGRMVWAQQVRCVVGLRKRSRLTAVVRASSFEIKERL